jgi:hypothetical protein
MEVITELLHGGSFGLGGFSPSKKKLKCEPIPAGGYCQCRYCLDEAPWLALNEYSIEEHVQPSPHFRRPLTPCENLLSTRVLRRRAGLICSKVLALPNFAFQCDCIVADNGIILGETRRPRHIFIHIGKSCRSLAIFADKLLSYLDEECRFILFTAGTDRFTPLDTFRKGRVRTPWQQVLANPRILAWWTENKSPSLKEASLRALPLGMVSPDLPMLLIGDGEKDSSQVSAQSGCHNMLPTWTNAFFDWSRSNEDIRRPPARRVQKIFACWRSRGSGVGLNAGVDSGAERRKVEALFHRSDLGDLVAWHEPTLAPREFMIELGRHQFVACVPGAGCDPNPKLFEALLMGAIPIARKCSVVDELTGAGLPVAVIDEWEDITLEKLKAWKCDLATCAMDNSGEVLAKMTNRFWFDFCCRSSCQFNNNDNEKA